MYFSVGTVTADWSDFSCMYMIYQTRLLGRNNIKPSNSQSTAVSVASRVWLHVSAFTVRNMVIMDHSWQATSSSLVNDALKSWFGCRSHAVNLLPWPDASLWDWPADMKQPLSYSMECSQHSSVIIQMDYVHCAQHTSTEIWIAW